MAALVGDGDAGDHARASAALEAQCDFVGAAREALAAGDPRRAAHLAALGGDEQVAQRALTAIATLGPPDAAAHAAGDLLSRGFARHAGELYARLGDHLEAGRAFAAAHESIRAAAELERARRPADAARVLEAALRARPGDSAARVALARLLARHGRIEGAVRALQQLDPEAKERAAALPLLARLLGQLGLEDAAETVKAEMARLGVVESDPEEPAAPPSVRGTAPVLFGRYEVSREVAATVNARVLEAVDRVSSERVAVKMLAASNEGTGRDALLRFEREASALAQLQHPNVVPLRGYIPEGPAMVLAWMSGGSLADLLAREGIAPARAVEIAGAVLGALGEAHRLGILHRDIKPSNVLFDGGGTARLSDFGAAHLGDLSTTATAGAIGTFMYMAPEQRLGRPASVASDLYGVGALLLEMLTGEPPQVSGDARWLLPPSEAHPDLGPAHDAIVARLLEHEQARRPTDAFEARRLLGSLAWPTRLAPIDPAAPATARAPSAPPASKRSRLTVSFEVGDGRDAPLRRRDAWLDRDVLVLPADEPNLALARSFAQAGHPALPTVLRVDLGEGAIWVAVPGGQSLADSPRAVGAGQLARLGEAVAALHAALGAHGSIDLEHLYWHDGVLTLAYPRRASGPDGAASDLAALERLREPP